jgi:outer membrane scaffolding protein for murein synthesis (MipA/OmpV family)
MRTRSLLSAFAVLAIGSGLAAQDAPLTFGVKAGAGAVVSNSGDQNARANVNLAFFSEYKLAGSSSVFGELKYRSFRAMYHEVTQFGAGYTLNGTYVVPNASSTPAVPGIVMASSVDVRRDPVEGLGLGFGFRSKITENLAWQAGVTVDWLKSTQEVTGQITVNTGVTATTTREGLSYTPTSEKVKPGAFVGLQWNLSRNLFVETNLSYVAFQQVNYVPMSYTGVAAHTETKNVGKTLFEVNCGFRF